MPLYNTKPVFLILLPLLMLHHNWNLSFEFSNFFGPYRNEIITYQGDAIASNGTIQLTKVKNSINMPFSVGRASYAIPMHLYDPKIGLASFTTTFSFIVRSNGQIVGDGIAFFIVAPNHSKIPESSSGGYLGLFSPETAFNSLQNQIVAVEFDTFANQWDPPYAHVGINVNSIRSLQTVRWAIESDDNVLTTVVATINYDALSHRLSVVVNSVNRTTISFSEVIDLRAFLPEWVIVGFSGATGGFVETHEILSWTFNSNKN